METVSLKNDEIPIMGEIIGWRCWRYYPEDSLLWALHHRYCWLPGETQNGHVGDDSGGIYAFKTRSRAEAEARNDKWEVPIVVGSVRLWGDAIEAENGWRSEFAVIESLDFVYFSKKAQKDYYPQPKLVERRTPVLWGLYNRTEFVEQPAEGKFDKIEFLTKIQRLYLTERLIQH